MSHQPKRQAQNDLNVALHMISGDMSESVNIPFADDESPAVYKNLENLENSTSNSNNSSISLDIKSEENDGNAESSEKSERIRKKSLPQRRNLELKIKIERSDSGSDSESSTDPLEKRDKPGPLKSYSPTLPRGLRRNSISMPVLNEMDLDKLRNLHMGPGETETESEKGSTESIILPPPPGRRTVVIDDNQSLTCSMAAHDSSDDDEKPMVHKSIFRNKRRASINPLPAIRLNDKEMMVNEYDSQSVNSQANSITSVGSLASLLKEKMAALPALIRKRKKASKDYKIRAFVGILFLVIVFLVGYAYIMYNQKVMSRLYFDQIKFSKSKRILRVFDSKGNDLLSGKLGSTLNLDKPYDCLPDDRIPGSLCLEWNKITRFYMTFDTQFASSLSTLAAASSVRCYKIRWETLINDYLPTDCFNIGHERGQWFGGGLTKNKDWPLDSAKIPFGPFVTGDAVTHQWGNAIKRYFLNSLGVAIEVDADTPLYISINDEYKDQFCLRAANDDFAFVNTTNRPQLKYRICTGDDMKILHHSMTQKSLWDGLKESDLATVNSLLDEPVYQIPISRTLENLTDTSISNYTENVIAVGIFRLGHVLINEFWQKEIGDYELDSERFKSLEDTINVLHRRGFRISLTIQPFISTQSKSFAEAVDKKLLIFERNSEKSIPALTRYKSSLSAAMLDVTNNATIPWLIKKLDKLVKKYGIDSFYLDFGTASDMPRYYETMKPLLNPDEYKTEFTNRINGPLRIIGVSGAVSVPQLPAFLSLPPVNTSWVGLQTVITSTLSYGIIGYPFVIPGPVGGDYFLQENSNTTVSYLLLETPPMPEKELYIRWLQLATFLPVLRFTHLPSDYKDDLVSEVAKELSAIRQKTVIPLLKKYLRESMNDGLPLLRPLWMLDPTDPACLYVNDEFSIGEELIVAPILMKGQFQREVYLPQGVWKDGIDGSFRKGSRWIHHYRVAEDKIAYFVKMPDDTRF